MRSFFVAMMTAAVFVIWGLFMAGPAKAAPHTIVTEVEWGGSYCITIATWSKGYRTACNPAYTYQLTETWRVPGENVGADPIMGNAAWAECRVYVDGVLDYSDYATAGDGTDVNCSRTISPDGAFIV